MRKNQEATVFPPQVRSELAGWVLFWVDLEAVPGSSDALATLRGDVEARARASHVVGALAEHPTAAAVRRLFREAGCDPTRYRPSSEALLRRVLKGEALPAINPLVDLNNCLSVELVVPACVVAYGKVKPPITLRAGALGETMLSMRGPLDLVGKPLLADVDGPFGTPITDSERVKVLFGTTRAWMVAYLPSGVVSSACAERAVIGLLGQAPVARVLGMGATS